MSRTAAGLTLRHVITDERPESAAGGMPAARRRLTRGLYPTKRGKMVYRSKVHGGRRAARAVIHAALFGWKTGDNGPAVQMVFRALEGS